MRRALAYLTLALLAACGPSLPPEAEGQRLEASRADMLAMMRDVETLCFHDFTEAAQSSYFLLVGDGYQERRSPDLALLDRGTQFSSRALELSPFQSSFSRRQPRPTESFRRQA
ncbi:MAG: hypothetical protein AAF568_10515, partial [Pseudomonadota bacterium]